MKVDDLDLLVRENVRHSIKKHVNEERQMNESVLLGVVAASLSGYLWLSFRQSVKKAARSKAFSDFIEEHDTDQLLARKIPDLTRRFKVVKSFSDLEMMERRTAELIDQLEQLHGKIDEFVASQERLGGRVRDRVARLSQSRLHQEIRSHLEDIIGSTRKGFEQEIENRKDELLGEI